MKEPMFVSFSGGRTSAFMCWYLKKHHSEEFDLIFVFANTGQEHEKTLDFVNQCDARFELNLVWLEAVVSPDKGSGTTHKIVSYETASRNGEPFEEVIKKYGIPNRDWPHCTRELKIAPIESYMREKHSVGSLRAIGIRSDEMDRVNPDKLANGEIVYPLAFWFPVTKSEVRHWWSLQDFDLEVPEHLGNCVTCWKKSSRKLMTIAKNEPARFNFFREMEKYAHVTPREEEHRVFFRGKRTVDDIFEMAKSEFVEFKDNKPELQLRLIDPIDWSNGCDESCEAH